MACSEFKFRHVPREHRYYGPGGLVIQRHALRGARGALNPCFLLYYNQRFQGRYRLLREARAAARQLLEQPRAERSDSKDVSFHWSADVIKCEASPEGGCPFRAPATIASSPRCCLSRREVPVTGFPVVPPDWCRLRAGPVVVQLAEREVLWSGGEAGPDDTICVGAVSPERLAAIERDLKERHAGDPDWSDVFDVIDELKRRLEAP